MIFSLQFFECLRNLVCPTVQPSTITITINQSVGPNINLPGFGGNRAPQQLYTTQPASDIETSRPQKFLPFGRWKKCFWGEDLGPWRREILSFWSMLHVSCENHIYWLYTAMVETSWLLQSSCRWPPKKCDRTVENIWKHHWIAEWTECLHPMNLSKHVCENRQVSSPPCNHGGARQIVPWPVCSKDAHHVSKASQHAKWHELSRGWLRKQKAGCTNTQIQKAVEIISITV